MSLKTWSVALLTVTLVPGFPMKGSSEEPVKPKAKPNASSSKNPSKSSKEVQPDRSAGLGQYLARTALSYRGAPYRFGGQSARTGFDCSGLVQAVCKKWGVLVPRVASDQYRLGKSVEKKNLQPGDLVFFKNTYKRGLSHVGIFIGDNCFVHAATTRTGVIISRLDSGYHKEHYLGAKRLDLSKLPAPKNSKPAEAVSPEKIYIDTEDQPASEVTTSRR